MDRERAETYLRLLAEAELRRAMNAPAGRRGWWSTRLELAARALCALGAVGVDVANSVQADFGLAVAERRDLPAPHLVPERDEPEPRQVSCRVVPVGQVISIGDGDGRRELLLVAYAQSAAGARFMGTGERFLPFPATDDRGVRYQISWMIGPAAMEMLLRPDPRHQIRWLDLTPAGQPAIRVHLDPRVPPEVSVTRDAHRPGELMLDVIAARIILAALSRERLAADAELRSFVGAGPGYIVAALDGTGLLPPDSPLPGQLAGLCTRIGLDGHGITAPPAGDLPERSTAGRRPDHDRGPASRRGPHHHAPAGQRRHARSRLALRPGHQADVDAVGTRQQRPLARHPAGRRERVGERHQDVPGDHPPARSRHRPDRGLRSRAIGSGPGHPAAQPRPSLMTPAGPGSWPRRRPARRRRTAACPARRTRARPPGS
jgi:hypothetical protein